MKWVFRVQMRGIYLLFPILLFQAENNFGQIVYFEDFGTGCSTGNLATTFGWTNVNTGTNQVTANIWYVSAAENGVGSGNCGVGCGGTNSRTLHISAATAAGGDLGAAYFESSAFICGFLGLCATTNKRIQSPTINCTGISNITLSFDYIENGEGASDNATVWYSADNGTTWTQIDDPPKTTLCGAQGLWTTRTLTLPASADNNAGIRIGFNWVNNGNGVATDPSFAVDNIQVGLPVVLSAEVLAMHVHCVESDPVVFWKTQSEFNADYYAVYKSNDAVNWRLLNTIPAQNSSGINTYSITDSEQVTAIHYYYIEQVDFDGTKKSYPILGAENCVPESDLQLYPNPSDGSMLTITSARQEIQEIEILSMDGKLIYKYVNSDDTMLLKLNPDLPPGHYLVKVLTPNRSEILQLIVSDSDQGIVH